MKLSSRPAIGPLTALRENGVHQSHGVTAETVAGLLMVTARPAVSQPDLSIKYISN